MRRLLFSLLLLAAPAFAGEKYLGTIVATTVKSNDSTAASFYVPNSAKLSIQCDASAYVLTDSSATLTTANGVKVSADTIFPTSTGPNYRLNGADAGANGGASVQALAVSGTANCKVFERTGTE